MKTPVKLFLPFAVLALFILAPSQEQTARPSLNAEKNPIAVNTQSQVAPVKKTVLLLFAYQPDLPSALLAVHGIQAEFGNVTDMNLDVYYEYLDLNRFSGDTYQQQLLSLLVQKYQNKSIDLVLIRNDAGITYWLEHRSEIAAITPMVVYDISPEHLAAHQLPLDLTGVSANKDYAQSVRWILKARPSVNEIVIVYGVGQADQEYIQPADALKDNVGRQVQWSDWSNLPLTEIKRRAATLPPSSVILYQAMFEDAAGVKYRPVDVLRELVAVSAVPILSGFDQLLGTGTLGGYTHRNERQAGQAALLGLRILRGEPASSIPFVINQSNQFMFDHLALQRFNIPLSDLPPESIIINRQYSFWESFRPQIIAVSAVFMGLILLMVYLIYLNRQLNKTRLALSQLNINLETQVQDRTERLNTANMVLRSEITERERAKEAEREQRTLAEALRDTATALNSTLKFDDVLDRILDYVGRVVPHDAANIMLLDDDGNTMSITRGRNDVERYANDSTALQLPMATSPILEQVMRSGQALVIPDTHVDPIWFNDPATRRVRSLVISPIRIREHTVGFLNVESATPSFFNFDHAERLQAFADQAAIAIDNAQLYAEVQNLAITDTLTGIYNRRGFFQLGEREVGRALRFQHQLAIVMLDIDHFKRVNDTYGHPIGDRILRTLAEVCRTRIRSVDVVARIDGDEFILLLTETDLAGAAQMTEHLRKAVEQMVISAELDESTVGKTVRVTISQGVVGLKPITPNITDLLSRADQALYAAKEAGRNRVVVGD